MGIEYFKRCMDCGRFVPKRLWIKKCKGYHGALCYDCLSTYEDER